MYKLFVLVYLIHLSLFVFKRGVFLKQNDKNYRNIVIHVKSYMFKNNFYQKLEQLGSLKKNPAMTKSSA